jgi:hypothetical protein
MRPTLLRAAIILEEIMKVSVQNVSPQNRQRNKPLELTGVFWNAAIPDI